MRKLKVLGGIVITFVLFFAVINIIPPKKNVKENQNGIEISFPE